MPDAARFPGQTSSYPSDRASSILILNFDLLHPRPGSCLEGVRNRVSQPKIKGFTPLFLQETRFLGW
jgi:hypothetical protein